MEPCFYFDVNYNYTFVAQVGECIGFQNWKKRSAVVKNHFLLCVSNAENTAMMIMNKIIM